MWCCRVADPGSGGFSPPPKNKKKKKIKPWICH